MKFTVIKDKIKSIPFVGWFRRWIYNLSRLNNIKHIVFMQQGSIETLNSSINLLKNQFTDQQNQFQDQQKQLQSQQKSNKQLAFNLEDKINLFDQKLENKSDIDDTIKLYEKLLSDKEHLLVNLKKVDNLIQEANKRLPPNFTEEQLQQLSFMKHDKFNSIYKEFEDKFRGTKDTIKSDLEIYLPFVKSIENNTHNTKILDIGCGRGEWLELLQESGYKPMGIDLNETMVKECQKQSLDVKQVDALKYLKSLPNSTLSLITGFHIIEHFNSFDDVLELLQESYRVLSRGGLIIYETPNPRNILVSSSDFYLDPSHNRPLHPMTMKFFAKQIGFKNSLALIINNKTLKDIDELDFNTIDDYVYIGRNYALMGEKP